MTNGTAGTSGFNAYLQACPTRQVVGAISDKWVTLVVAALGEGSLRFGQIAKRVDGVSQKMLTQTLRGLERDGFLERRVTASVPVRVDYELTELGQELREIVWQIKAFAEERMPSIAAARERYEARS